MSEPDQNKEQALYAAIRSAMTALESIPEGENATVDGAFNTLHDAYWSECPCPAGRVQRRGQEVAEAA